MKHAYPYRTVPEALRALHRELGTWRQVGEYLALHGKGKFYASLVYRAQEGVGIERVRLALENASLIPPFRRKDPRITRAWHGSKEQAKELDDKLKMLGYGSVQRFVYKRLLCPYENEVDGIDG